MKKPTSLYGAIALAFTLMISSHSALAKDPEPAFMKSLYPPELVMANHRAIGLNKGQRTTITKAIQATQASTVELGWSMQDAASRLTDAMNQPKIDREVAIEAAEQVMSIEGQVKRAHLALLIDIKNTLDVEQQRKLEAIRAKGD
jgi:Spy/CpxP family protein refolding chaperone